MKKIITIIALAITIGTQAQSVKFYGSNQLYVEIDDNYSGFGIGFENVIKNKTVLSIDLALAFGRNGSTVLVQPGVQFYVNSERKGFYYGPVVKWIKTKEEDEANGHIADNLYGLGFNLGYKSVFKEKYALVLDFSPHRTIGGPEESNAIGLTLGLGLSYTLK